MNADFVIAVYAAIVSTVLAIARLAEFRQSRERLHFSVYAAELHVAGQPGPKPEFVAIAIGNRAPFAMHITQIGFTLRGGTSVFSNPIPGLTPVLPQKLEPTDGLTWLMVPARLADGMPDCVDELVDVYAYDGSSRRYQRRLTRDERERLRALVGPALRTWPARIRAWWLRRTRRRRRTRTVTQGSTGGGTRA